MGTKYTYLLINIFTIVVPLLRSFEPKLQFYKQWKYYLPGTVFTSLFFLIWDAYFTHMGVWRFNDSYILGYKFLQLPLEEYLFFITVPYSCTFIYVTMKYLIKKNIFPTYSGTVLRNTGILFFIFAFFFLSKIYTFSVFMIFGLVLPVILFWMRDYLLDKLILTCLISLIPMAIVNGLLTALPVLIYDDRMNLGLRLYTIPIEDFFYAFILLTMNISIFEGVRMLAARTPRASVKESNS